MGKSDREKEQAREALTNWIAQRQGLVRTGKRKKASEVPLHPGKHGGGDKLGEEKKVSKLGYSRTGKSRGRDKLGQLGRSKQAWALTSWKAQREGQVKIRKETN
jgi:uncharacterized protein (UPF0548 family)